MNTKILFILKRRHDFSQTEHTGKGLSSGLLNSSSFISDSLGDVASLEVVVDGNDINRVVTTHSPAVVIIEALWVTPEKITELSKIHKDVKWVIQLHSDTPFLAGEGIAFSWIGHYLTMNNVWVSANSPRMVEELKIFARNIPRVKNEILYLPNCYPKIQPSGVNTENETDVVSVGCFGAIRPLKNTMIQAVAAVDFTNRIGKKLHFHINCRVQRGEAIIKNLQNFFMHLIDAGHQLIIHDWMPHDKFLEMCSKMDVGMQVSFSETFNIVAADLVTAGVPIVGSKELPWLFDYAKADATDVLDISKKLQDAYSSSERNVAQHQESINNYSDQALSVWMETFCEIL